MSKVRAQRLGEQIKKEVSEILQREMKDPGLGFVSITDVDVTGDLSQVKIYFSVLGNEKALEESLASLRRGTGFIRSEIAKRIRLRHTPTIEFVVDKSMVAGGRILQIMDSMKKEEEPGGKG